MNRYLLVLKLILTPFISVLILFLTDSNLFLYPLVFSLIISLSNYNLHRFGLSFGIILGIALSYLSFFAGYLGYGLFYKVIELIGIPNDITFGEWFYTDLAFLIPAFIIAPLLTLLLNKSLFNDTKTKITSWIVIITIGVLVLISFIHNDQKVENYFNIMNVWQLIIIFGLQLIINQKYLKITYCEEKANSQQRV